MNETTLRTTGLHCPSCSKLVDMTVGDLDGVESVKTDHVTGHTQVSFDAKTVGIDEIIAAIREVGYDAVKP